MADDQAPLLKRPNCATCKDTGKVKQANGTYVNCLPCSIPLYGSIPLHTDPKDVPGAVATGPGDASEETTQ